MGATLFAPTFFTIFFCNQLQQEIKKNSKGVVKMNNVRVSFDSVSYYAKPKGNAVAQISSRIGSQTKSLNSDNIRGFIGDVGLDGHTFCPATFKNGKRNKENFEQQQFLVLDIDNPDPHQKISFEAVKSRADDYDLPILFAYDTFTSKNHDKFRVVFLNDIPIPDRKVAEAMQLAIGTIFPESDSTCYKDISKMYFGGQEVIYFNEDIPEINVEVIFRNLTHFTKDKHKANHYKQKLAKFSQETGIALNPKGFLDVTVSDVPTELHGATSSKPNGKNSPNAIIYNLNKTNIIVDGENFPKKYYHINFDNTSKSGTNNNSVAKTYDKKISPNHKPYRSFIITQMYEKCQLYREFESATRRLHHGELHGISTNLLSVETGLQRFIDILSKNSSFYAEKKDAWQQRHLPYIKQNNYHPENCNNFCPYRNQCSHGTNILSTVHPKRGTMEKVIGYKETFYPISEVEEDVYQAIHKAYCANDKKRYVINAMTSIGKTTSYLKIMSEYPTVRFLIAVPTNLLKDEVYDKAVRMGISICKTPSLEQIKNEIPDKVWNHIQQLYRGGQYRSVHPYIEETLKKKDIPCLREYLKAREELKSFSGSMITTHRYLLNMDEKRLKEYGAVIIDEDIIFKSIISNQGEITISELKKLSKETTQRRLSKKIDKLLKLSKYESCIELDSFEFDDETDFDDTSILFDIPSFCLTERFYLRKSSKEINLKEDTISFIKPATFKDVKYIIVSATANEDICHKFFGSDNVNFYKCKKAQYKGELNQYPHKSMSRTCITNNPGIIRRLMKHLNIYEDKVITFMKEDIGHLHFGNTEGSNTLEGEDILVVGTPYHAEFLYKLVAFTMGLDFNEDEEMSSQIVEHNGYKSWFRIFKNENLRGILLWMIESELEQAVGRARLLRNNCTVHLFSNFPLSQAIMINKFDYNKD